MGEMSEVEVQMLLLREKLATDELTKLNMENTLTGLMEFGETSWARCNPKQIAWATTAFIIYGLKVEGASFKPEEMEIQGSPAFRFVVQEAEIAQA